MREDCSTAELLTHLVPGQGLEPCIFLFVGEVASPAALTGHLIYVCWADIKRHNNAWKW